VYDEMIEPSQVPNIFTRLSGTNIPGSVSVLAYKHVAVLGLVDNLPAAVSDELVQNISQPAVDGEIPRQENLPFREHSELTATALTGLVMGQWEARDCGGGTLQMLAGWDHEIIFWTCSHDLGIW
jgi:hypothetical protein